MHATPEMRAKTSFSMLFARSVVSSTDIRRKTKKARATAVEETFDGGGKAVAEGYTRGLRAWDLLLSWCWTGKRNERICEEYWLELGDKETYQRLPLLCPLIRQTGSGRANKAQVSDRHFNTGTKKSVVCIDVLILSPSGEFDLLVGFRMRSRGIAY